MEVNEQLWEINIEKDESKIDTAISYIDFFKQEHWYKVDSNITIFNNQIGQIWWDNESLHFKIVIVYPIIPSEIEEIMGNKSLWMEFHNKGNTIFVNYASISLFEANLVPDQGYLIFRGILTNIFIPEKQLKKQTKFIALIKCPLRNFLGLYFPAKNLIVGDTIYEARIIEIKIKNVNLELYLYGRANLDELYLFIEPKGETPYFLFKKIINEILLVVAFICGISPGREVFILDNINPDDNYSPFMSYFVHAEEFSDSIQEGAIARLDNYIHEHNRLHRFNGINSIQQLIEKCMDSPAYRRTLSLMIHTNTQPDFIKVVTFAVALESIAELIYNEHKKTMKPVNDKKLMHEIKTNLRNVISNYSSKISESAFAKFSGTIDHINKPTNIEMLTKPFEILGIPLSDLDKKAISNRNDFLHGRLPFEPGSHELSIIGCRLQYCVNSLLLKYCNYKGAVHYYATLYQFSHKLKVDSQAFIII